MQGRLCRVTDANEGAGSGKCVCVCVCVYVLLDTSDDLTCDLKNWKEIWVSNEVRSIKLISVPRVPP